MAPVKQLSLPLYPSEGESEMGNLIEPNSNYCSLLFDRVLERNNLLRALIQVRRNKGAPGIDGMTVDALPDYLKTNWPSIRKQLVDGTYRPKPVMRIEIPKPDGGMRKLGIPTVLDRLIQQSIAQVLQTAGERVLCSLQHYIGKSLRLKVNPMKSAVDRPWNRTFLGFTFSRKRGYKIKVADKALVKLKATIRTLSRRTRGHSLVHVIADLKATLLGWKAYFDISEILSPLRDLDKWLRRRLRCYQWKQWGRKGYRTLRRLGVERFLAWNTAKSAHGPWRLSASPALYQALPNRYFRNLGLPELAVR